nr:TRAP transporter large permease [Alkalibacter mobilis]
MFILLFLKVPVAFSMIGATLVYFLYVGTTMPTAMIVQRLIASCESFTYLAIPFFASAGVVFNYSGITSRLMNLANLIVGRYTGGLAQVNVVLSAMMGGLSGSANADAAMQSKMLVPEMERLGYSRAFSSVVTAASSCITPIIPPGIILILYATASNVSIAKMFMAGYIPGAIVMGSLMLVVYLISKNRGYKPATVEKVSLGKFAKSFVESLWALFLPFGIIMGLRFGVFTPTEAGAISVLYSIFVGAFIYKELKWKDAKNILLESIEATAGVMFIIAAANAFGIYLSWERIPILVSEALIANISSPVVLLLVINVLLLIVGMFFEGGAAMILLAPLLVPAVQALGIDLVHFGIVMCLNLTIAGFTPPFGSMMYVTLSITGVRATDYMRESLPFIFVLVISLLLVTLVPQITLFIPNWLMG